MPGQLWGPTGVLPAAGASTLAIDAAVHINASTTTVTTATLTATHSNCYIIAALLSNAAADVVTVKSGGGISFARIAGSANPNNWSEFWALFSSGTFSDTIVVTQSAAAFCTVDAFAVSGSGQTSLVWDAGGPVNGAPDPYSITTVNPNTMVLAMFREASASTPTAGAGFTQIGGADFMLTEYKLVATATTTSCTQTVGAGTSSETNIIAVVHT